MLWACLYFPQLAIDRLTLSGATHAIAVILQQGSRKQIVACNGAAHAQGIRIGLALNSAYVIAPNLLVHDYDSSEQQSHLEQLALWALRYSSWVTPRMPESVLVEIEASLTLFGGIDALLGTLHSDAKEQGLTMHIGVAPTPAAAALFARAGIRPPVKNHAAMRQTFARISLEHLALDAFTLRGLRQSGIRTIKQLQAIPAAALTRRFGHACVDLIYKLDGILPDPCPAFTLPDSFSEALDLPLEAPDAQALTFPLNRLLGALGGYLKAGDLGVKTLQLSLYHHRHPPTNIILSFLNATASQSHLLKIATERLANTRLPDPVTRLRIKASELAAIERDGKDLFQKSQAQTSSIQQVLDTLMARLGKDNLYTAMPGDDHRPEKAWMSALLESQKFPDTWPARPLWLLKEPRIATEPLKMTTQAERIENGWWDDIDVRRDYYIACNRHGSYFWVFRLRHDAKHMYIHGLFA